MRNVRFTIKLAGVNIGVHASFLSSKEFCKEYLTSEAADFEVSITRDDIAFEAAASEIECSDKYYETLAIYRKIAEALIHREILLVHGSTLKVGENGYMFTAASGVGKSTHAALWKKLLGEKATIINDDKPLLRINNDGVEVFGTPWSGEKSINTNTSAPLKSICFIEQNATNDIQQIEKTSAIDKLVPQIYKSDNAENVIKTLELANLLMKNVDFYQLKCNTDISAARLSYTTLAG